METFYLVPVNSRKSFYGKCKVIKDSNISSLISYTTTVARYFHDTNKMEVYGYFSATTATHINSFLKYYGFDTCSKKEIENYLK